MKKHSKAKIEKAKKMYMEYQSLGAIEKKVGIPRSSIFYHVKEKWKEEREMLKAELFVQMSEAKKVQFTSMTASTIHIMERSLKELAVRPEPPTIKEAAKAAEIMSMLDKITRLDDGTATDIVSSQEKPLTVEVIEQKLSADPFRQIESKEPEEGESND